MSGNNENGGGCGRVCSGCLYYIRSIPFRRCFLALLAQIDDHFVRSTIIFISTVLVIVSWFEFREIQISNTVFVYCLVLIICSFLTFSEPKGWLNKNYLELSRLERLQQNQRQQGARQRVRQQRPADSEQPPARALEQIQAAPPEGRHVQEAPFDFHHAEEPSESSNSVEPVSTSSGEPLQQVAPSDSGSNLPQLSTDPSTQSTHSTPLDVTNEDPRNDEPLQQVAPSNLGSNLPQSSTDPSTQSTHSTPLDDVTSEELTRTEVQE